MELFVKAVSESNSVTIAWTDESISYLLSIEEVKKGLSLIYIDSSKINTNLVSNVKEYSFTSTFKHIKDLEFLITALTEYYFLYLKESLTVFRFFARFSEGPSLIIDSFSNPNLIHIGKK